MNLIYLIAMQAFFVNKNDVDLFKEQGANYCIDLEDYHGNQTIDNIRGGVSCILTNLVVSNDPCLVHLVIVSAANIVANLGIEDRFGIQDKMTTLSLRELILKAESVDDKISVICASLSILANMSVIIHTRPDLLSKVEEVLLALLQQSHENPIILTHLLMLYKFYICDVHQSDESKLMLIIDVMTKIAVEGNSSGSAPYFVAIDILEKLHLIYEEETSSRIVKLLKLHSHVILAALIRGLPTAEDEKYFSCLKGYLKYSQFTRMQYNSQNKIPQQDLVAIYSCINDRLSKELEQIDRDNANSIDQQDYSNLFYVIDILCDFFSCTQDSLDCCKEILETTLKQMNRLVYRKDVIIDQNLIDMIMMILESHTRLLKSLSPVHLDFISKYILEKKYTSTLTIEFFQLLNSYIVVCGHLIPESIRDRFLIEIIMLVQNNTRKKRGNSMNINTCFGLLLFQSLVASMREYMTRSQIEDIVLSTKLCLENCSESECVMTACFTTLNICLLYEPVITIGLFQARDFLTEYINLLSKKLITMTRTSYDRKVLTLSVVSLLKYTIGTDKFATVNHQEIFKYSFLVLQYHYSLIASFESTDKMSLHEHTAYCGLQKKIMSLELVRGAESYVYQNFDEELEAKKQYQSHRFDDDSDDDDDDDLAASEESEVFVEYRFDVESGDVGQGIPIGREEDEIRDQGSGRVRPVQTVHGHAPRQLPAVAGRLDGEPVRRGIRHTQKHLVRQESQTRESED